MTQAKLNTRKLALAVRRIRNLDELADQIFDPKTSGPQIFQKDLAPLASGLHEAIKGAAEDLYAVFHPAEEPTDTIASIPMTTVQGREAAVLVSDALEALAPEFAGLQRAVHEAAREIGHDLARSVGAHIAATPKRLKGRAWVADAKRRRDAGVPLGDIIREAGRDADLEAAEQRGFDKGRNQALSIVLNERKNWSKDVVRDVLGKVSEAIVYMQKEG